MHSVVFNFVIMKHVFFIHSHTLFLSALGCINYLSLDHSDIVFLYARNYRNRYFIPDWTTFDISDWYASFQSGRKLLYNKKLRKIKCGEVDNFIMNNISENFTLYVPHFAFSLFQIFYTNNFCVKAYYVQEGGVQFKNAYSTKFPLHQKLLYLMINKFLLSDGRVKLPRKWYIDGFLSKQDSVEAFAISNTFFHYLPATVHIIKWPRLQIDYRIEPSSPIFVFDGFVSNHHIEEDFYLSKCNEIIKIEERNLNYIKFHPIQPERERNIIKSFFSSNSHCIEIEDQIPLEIVLSSNNDLTVVGFESSLLVFAKDLGHNVRSYGNKLIESKVFSHYKKISY